MNGDCQVEGFGRIGVIRGLPEGYSRVQAPNQIRQRYGKEADNALPSKVCA
jgi:hypothetical protein